LRLQETAIREVLVKGNSDSLRLLASTDNLMKGKVKESHFALELKSAVFRQIRKMGFPSFSICRDSLHV
jgi:hypothetical protein